MRLALISDQHANDVAFRAVVDDIRRVGVDRVVCLGDVAQGGAQPAETLDRLAELDCETVLGNADAFLLGEDVFEEPTREHLEVREWTLGQLSDDQMAQLRAFRATVEVELDGGTLLCFHGSPHSYDDILLPDQETDLEPWRAEADILAGGHTHRQWTRQIDTSLFVNPGSVGLTYDHLTPRDETRFTPVAEYGLLHANGAGAAVDFRRVPYSIDELREVIRASGRPHADEHVAMYEA
jgi:putative phosphoesterase